MTFSVGQTIGAYRILEQLGEGETATVYKAYHAALDRYVAIKALYPAYKDDPTFMARFQREARLVAKLDHPNIVSVYDFSEHESTPYLVMKFVHGETLKDRLRHGPLPVYECARILGAVGAALTYAHQHDVLHRDLKPTDILLEPDGDVYLTDFGLARILNVGAGGVTGGLVIGSPYYVSPEQGRGGIELDERSDQYSLGIILFEMITGDVPFSAGNTFGIIQDHIATPPPRPSLANPRVTRSLDDVVLRALSKNRDDRFPDIKTMVEAFQKSAAPPRPPTAPVPKYDLTKELAQTQALPGAAGGIAVMLTLQPGGQMMNLNGRTKYMLGRSEPNRPNKPDADFEDYQGQSLGVSRRHGVLEYLDGRLYYTDLKSSNGSRVNGVKLRAEIPMLLKDGDEIMLGRLAFRLYFAV